MACSPRPVRLPKHRFLAMPVYTMSKDLCEGLELRAGAVFLHDIQKKCEHFREISLIFDYALSQSSSVDVQKILDSELIGLISARHESL